MTLEQIRMFVTVADAGTIAAAANRLHKTQAAISIAIKRLQEEFNLNLLQKSGNRLSLTDVGQRFLPHFRYLLAQQTDISKLAHHLSEGFESKVELVFDAICRQQAIYDVSIATQQTFPNTEVFLTSVQRLGSLQRLIDEKADIAIMPWQHSFGELAAFETASFGRFEVVAVIHSNALETLINPPQRASDLRDIPLLMPQAFDIDIDIRKVMGVVPPFTIRTNDTDTQKGLLLKNAGWGYIPKNTIEAELESGELSALSLSDVNCIISGEIRVVRKMNKSCGPVSEFMWQQLLLQCEK